MEISPKTDVDILGSDFFDFKSLYLVWGDVRARKLNEIATTKTIFWFVGRYVLLL